MKEFLWKRKKQSALVCAVVVVVLVCLAASQIGKRRNVVAQTIEPATTTLQKGSFDQRVTADGTTEAANPYSIYIELSQEVEEVFVEVGDEVEEGQLLVTYDISDTKTSLENQLQQAQVSLANAQLSLDEMTQVATGTERIDLEAAVLSAQEALQEAEENAKTNADDLAEAEKNLPYYKQLLENDAISQSEYDTYVDEYETLVTNESTLQNKIESAKLELEKAQLNLAYGDDPLSDVSTANEYQRQLNSIQTYQSSVQSAQEDLAKLTEATYSPISGTVITCNAEEGQMLTDSTVMMEVADLSDLNVTAYVSEYDIASVQVGQAVELTTDGIVDKVYHGTVTKIEPVAESQSTISGSETVVPIVVHLDDPDENIKPGFSFDMEIITVSVEDADYLPISAVTMDRETGEYSVFVVGEGDILEKRTVEVGVSNDTYIQILSGLSEGEVVMEVPGDDVVEGTLLSDYATTPTQVQEISTDEESSILDSVTGGGSMGGGAPMSGGGAPMGGGGGPR